MDTDRLTVSVDSQLPSSTLSIEEFNQKWSELRGDTGAMAALSIIGILDHGAQVNVNPLKYLEEQILPVVEATSMSRDYDSMSGFSRGLPYDRAAELYINPPSVLTLTKDNHLKFPVVSEI
jgi:hypothetical protein